MPIERMRLDADNLTMTRSVEPYHRVRELLGVSEKGAPLGFEGWGSLIHSGFHYSSFEKVRKAIDLPAVEMAHLISASLRSVDRWKAEKKRISPEASDRLFRVARIIAHAEEVFGDRENGHVWLREENIGLGGKRPLDLLDTDIGATTVDNLLTRIEYGIY